MEFFYEEQATENGQDLIKADLKSDKNTEKAFHELEGTIDQQYQRTANVLKKLVSDERGIELDIPLESKISERAQVALDSLDSQIQNVEHLAQGYWKKVSTPSFWSSVTDSLGTKFEEVVKLGTVQPTSTTPEASNVKGATPVAGNRTEAELRRLSSDEDVYLNCKDTLPTNFNVDDHTSEIAALLEANKGLEHLMNSIVPEKVNYHKFWNIYFFKKDEIIEMERKRKKLLERKIQENKEVDWDDDEDDNDTKDKPKMTTPAVEKEESPNEDDENEDDDWE